MADVVMEGTRQGQGLAMYYRAKTEELELRIRDKAHNLRRLEAQRNELNTQGGLEGEQWWFLGGICKNWSDDSGWWS